MPTALVIAHEPDGPGSQVTVRLEQRGFAVHNHVVTDEMDVPNVANPFPDFAEFDLVVLMGSVRSLTRKNEIDSWIHDELDRIRKQHAADKPMLGICFGGQLLADALGGNVEEAPVTELGWYEIDVDDMCPIQAGPWMQWHHDRFESPPGSTVLARTSAAEQMFRIGTTVGTQFHPEVDVPHIEGWLTNVDAEYLGTYDQTAEAVLDATKENEAHNIIQCHEFVDWFLDQVAFPEGLPT